jgi:hypothetical protein
MLAIYSMENSQNMFIYIFIRDFAANFGSEIRVIIALCVVRHGTVMTGEANRLIMIF